MATERNYVAIVAGFRAAGDDYVIGDPVPVADIPNGQNLVRFNYVDLENSERGIRAVKTREEIDRKNSERRALTARERDREVLRRLEEEAAPARMGDYGEETADPPKRGPDLPPPMEASELARLHANSPGADPAVLPEAERRLVEAAENAAALAGLGVGATDPIGPAPSPNPAEGSGETPPPPEIPEDQVPADESEVDATDEARAKAEELGVDLRTVKGTGQNGRIKVGDVESAAVDENSAESS